MNAQQLKNSILQMAVQGKLVPQDPNDEPASALIERIRSEKEQLIKDKKIKKEKNPSFIFRGADNLPYENIGGEVRCIADEVPFEIPDSWEWVRLGNIGETNIGLTYKLSDVSQNGIAVMRSNNIQNGNMDYSDTLYVSCEVSERAMSQVGDILICARNGSRALVGKSAIIDKENLAFGAFMAIYRSICNPYIQLFINSYLFRGQLDGAKTTTINQVTQAMLKNQLCPLPPLAEQSRIVKAFKDIVPTIDAYKTAHSKIEKLNTDFPEQLKKSILQWAVQGKLVPQDENDEPASVLLKRIREEKAQLIKDKKIKKDKQESVIFKRDNSHYEKIGNIERCIDDEIPFDIPDSWEWCRFKTLAQLITCGYAATPKYVENGMPFISAKNVKPYTFKPQIHNQISSELYEKLTATTNPEKGDILLTRVGAGIGEACIIDSDLKFAIYVSLTLIKLSKTNLSSNYFLYWIDSPMGTDLSIKNIFGKGASQGNLNVQQVRDFLIPLPPLAEQQRIVTKIETVLSQISNL